MEGYLFRNGEARTSNSFWDTFESCKAKAKYSYIMGIQPAFIPKDDPRAIGKVFHVALERYTLQYEVDDFHGDGLDEWQTYLDTTYIRRDEDKTERNLWHWLRAMMRGYKRQWPVIKWKECHPERWFNQPVIGEDGEKVPFFRFVGKVDNTVFAEHPFVWGDTECEPGLYVQEHKTALRTGGDYFKRLWADPQIMRYARAVEHEFDQEVKGVLYNVVKKTKEEIVLGETQEEFGTRVAEQLRLARDGKLGKRLRQKKDENEAEFHARRVEKGIGEVDALQSMQGDTDEEFEQRLDAFHNRPDAYERKVIAIDRDMVARLNTDLARMVNEFKDVYRRGDWCRNWSHCHSHFRKCDFWKLCTTDDNPVLLESDFRLRSKDHQPQDKTAEYEEPIW